MAKTELMGFKIALWRKTTENRFLAKTLLERADLSEIIFAVVLTSAISTA